MSRRMQSSGVCSSASLCSGDSPCWGKLRLYAISPACRTAATPSFEVLDDDLMHFEYSAIGPGPTTNTRLATSGMVEKHDYACPWRPSKNIQTRELRAELRALLAARLAPGAGRLSLSVSSSVVTIDLR